MLEAIGISGAGAHGRRVARRRRWPAVGDASPQLAAVRRQEAVTAVPTRDGDAIPQQLAGLAAMIAAGLPLRCVAIRRPATTTRTRTRRRPHTGLTQTSDGLSRSSATSRRAASPIAC